MTGCVSASVVCLEICPGEIEKDRCTPYDDDNFTKLTSCVQTVELSRGQFFKVSAERRNVVVCEFGLLRDAVDAQERAALIEFDDYVRHGMKVLETEHQALQVKLWQLAAYCQGGLVSPDLSTGESKFTNYGLLAPYFYPEGIQIIRGIGKYWSVSNATNQAALGKMQCHLLAQMRQFVTEATEDFSLTMFRKYASMQPMKTPFRGQKLAAIDLSKVREIGNIHAGSVGGMAVNADGSLFAIADTESNSVCLVSLVRKKELERWCLTGKKPGEFRDLVGLCFGPDGSSLLLLTSDPWIYEMSLSGKHIRRIGKHKYHVPGMSALDANSEIIVFCSMYAVETGVHVFDYHSGTFLRSVSSEQTLANCVSIKLSPDGSCFVVAQNRPQLLSVFTVHGALAAQFSSSEPYPRCVTFFASGEIAVIGRTVGDHGVVAVYSTDALKKYQLTKRVSIHHPLPSIIPCLFNVGDFMCAFTKTEMQIFL